MANFLTQAPPPQLNPHEQRYNRSRMNLLLVVVFTAINLILLVTNADTYFLFSAFIPYFITVMGMLLCGRFPEEYYDGMEDMVFLDNSAFVILLIISVVLTLLYLLAWIMSGKKRVGWLIFALVFFALDTIGMLVLNGIAVDSVIDILFHAWVIVDLILGIRAHYKLKKMPVEEAQPAEYSEGVSEAINTETQNSPVIRVADPAVKHRVLLETRVLNFDICYRRVKHTNELVINGNIYDEIEGVVEYPHTLKAQIDGHSIEASYNGTYSIISVDGERAAKKLRLF